MALTKQILYAQNLQDEFNAYGRGNSFTRYDLLLSYYDDLEDNVNLDVIALCGEWNEFKNVKEFNSDYNTTYKTIEEIAEDHTVLFDEEDQAFIVEAF